MEEKYSVVFVLPIFRGVLLYVEYYCRSTISVAERKWFIAVSIPAPFPTLEKFWFRFWLRFRLLFQYLAQLSKNNNYVQNIAFPMLEAVLFPRKFASHL